MWPAAGTRRGRRRACLRPPGDRQAPGQWAGPHFGRAPTRALRAAAAAGTEWCLARPAFFPSNPGDRESGSLPVRDGRLRQRHAIRRLLPPRQSGFSQRAAGRFVAWGAASALITFGVLGMFSIGFPFFVAGIGLTMWLVARRQPTDHRGAWGILVGIGVVLMVIGFITASNSECSEADPSSGCEEWSPWPWFGTGGALIAASLIGYHWRRPGHGRNERR